MECVSVLAVPPPQEFQRIEYTAPAASTYDKLSNLQPDFLPPKTHENSALNDLSSRPKNWCMTARTHKYDQNGAKMTKGHKK